MVQNWENFMSPSGGAIETPFMTDPLTSMAAGFGVDMLMRPQADMLARTHVARSYRQYIGEQSRLDLKREGTIRTGFRSDAKTRLAVDIHGEEFEQKYGRTKVVSKSDFRKSFKPGKNYAMGASRLLRGASWMLLASGFAMMAESLAMPGLTKSAQQSDRMAMGGMGPLDSQQAYTQRQRALMAIHDSQLGLRNVIGNEAGHFHR